MSGSQALETAIGLVLMFFIVSLAASTLVEVWSRLLNKRARAFEGALAAVLAGGVTPDGSAQLDGPPPRADAGLTASDMLAFVDRGQGGMATLQAAGLNPQAVTTMDHTLQVLRAAGRITAAQVADSQAFMRDTASGG
mgnify:CR=1 FL=1